MSASNGTPNLNLPKFIASDKPTWLGDFNNAMDKLDAANAVLVGVNATLQNELNIANAALVTANARITALALATGHVGI